MLETFEPTLTLSLLSLLIQSLTGSYLLELSNIILRTCSIFPRPQMPSHTSHHHPLLDHCHSLPIGLTPLHSICHVSIRVIFLFVSKDTCIYELMAFFNPGKFPAIISANTSPPSFPPFFLPRNHNTCVWIFSVQSLMLMHSSVSSSRSSSLTLQPRTGLWLLPLELLRTFTYVTTFTSAIIYHLHSFKL